MNAMRGVAILIALLVTCEARGASPAIVGSKFELFVTDVDESARFYTTLGFVIAERKPDGYTTVSSGTTIVALSPVSPWLPLRWLGFLRNPPLGVEIVLYTDQLEQLRADVDAAGYDPSDIVLQSWGDRDFRVSDHDGYYVRVSERRNPSSIP